MINLDITQTPPTHEPERQYYYMAKARQYVKKKSEELGRPLTMFLKTFGGETEKTEITHTKKAISVSAPKISLEFDKLSRQS